MCCSVSVPTLGVGLTTPSRHAMQAVAVCVCAAHRVVLVQLLHRGIAMRCSRHRLRYVGTRRMVVIVYIYATDYIYIQNYTMPGQSERPIFEVESYNDLTTQLCAHYKCELKNIALHYENPFKAMPLKKNTLMSRLEYQQGGIFVKVCVTNQVRGSVRGGAKAPVKTCTTVIVKKKPTKDVPKAPETQTSSAENDNEYKEIMADLQTNIVAALQKAKALKERKAMPPSPSSFLVVSAAESGQKLNLSHANLNHTKTVSDDVASVLSYLMQCITTDSPKARTIRSQDTGAIANLRNAMACCCCGQTCDCTNPMMSQEVASRISQLHKDLREKTSEDQRPALMHAFIAGCC